MKLFRSMSVLVLALLTAVPLAAEAASEGLRQDAAEYAKRYRVELDEAVRRLQLQRAVSDLEGVLAEEEADAFAGLWIQHEPSYRVVVRFTSRAAEERLKARIAGGPLANLVETRDARFTLRTLEAMQREVHERAWQALGQAESRIDVVNNDIELFATDTTKLRGLRIPAGVEIKRVAKLSSADSLPELPGGSALSDCTAGFGVIAPSGEVGISTAGHCNNDQYFQGIHLPFRAEKLSGDQEVQWNSACDRAYVSNRINSGIGTRGITSTRHRTNQSIGTYVCKMGKTTGRTCGTIADKNIQIQPGFNSTFIRVDGYQLRGPGDSGAPWFVEDIAYGIHWGGWGMDPNDALYMAINYISALNVSVLTYDPGPVCNLTPFASFSITQSNFFSYTFNASSSYDPDGSIASYTWDFGDGEVITTTSPTISHGYGPGQYVIYLTVTDNEGKTNTTWRNLSTCGGYNQPECPY